MIDIIDKIENYLHEMSFSTSLTMLSTNEINNIIKNDKNKYLTEVYDSKYLGMFRDKYACYLIIFKDDIENRYYISKIWFIAKPEIIISTYNSQIDDRLNQEEGFSSLKEAQNALNKIKFSSKEVKMN